MSADGVQELSQLKQAGFSDDEITQYKNETTRSLNDAGFRGDEINDYWGVKTPDVSALQTHFEANLSKAPAPTGSPVPQGTPAPQATGQNADQSASPPSAPAGEQTALEPSGTQAAKPEVKQAHTFLSALEAGLQISVSGLLERGQAPDMVLPDDAPMFHRIANQAGTLLGDLPVMIPGGIVGGVAGLFGGGMAGTFVAPGVGTLAGAAGGSIVGTNAGAFAAPVAIREMLMDHYKNGNFHSFGDFWERAAPGIWKTTKAAVTGALTSVAGVAAGELAPVAGGVAAKAAAATTAELATMTTVGAALDKRMPKLQDFADGALLIGGLHIATGLPGAYADHAPLVKEKLMDIYAKTGLRPEEVASDAAKDPVILGEILAKDSPIPEKYQPLAEGPATSAPVETTNVPLPNNAGEVHTTLQADENAPAAELKVEKLPPPEAPPAPEPQKSEADMTELDKHKAAVADRIGIKEDAKSSLSFDKIYTNMVDDLHPLKQFTKALSGDKPVETKNNPYELARLTRGSFGKADQALERGPFTFDGLKQTGTPGFKQIMEPIKDDVQGFREFAASRRAVELEAKGIKTGIPLDSAKAVVDAGTKKFGKAFEQMVSYQNDVLTYLKDSGVLSPEAHAAMVEGNKSYVPFYRILEEGGGGPSAGKGLNVKNPIKAIKGSELQIQDPIESVIKNTYAYISLAEKNRALNAMRELAAGAGENGKALMEKQTAPMKPIEVKAEEVKAFMKEHGIEGDPAAFTIFRAQNLPLAKDEIALFNNGKQEIYKVAPEVAEAVKNLDRESLDFVTKILAKPSQWLRAGATIAPDFMARNWIRDQATAFIANPGAYNPIHALSGMASLFKKDASYQDWLKSGGANAAMISIDRNYIQDNIFKLEKETGFMNATWNVVKTPLHLVRVSGELIENATRLGDFKRNVAEGKDLFEAGLASRDVTLDFARMGAKTRAMNAITAFWNAHLQGVDKTVRAIADRPLESSLKIAAAITAPSIMLWWANHDDPRWKEIPRWQKDNFWIVMTKDTIYRIPKPAEVGLMFGSVPERALDAYFEQNPKAFSDFSSSMIGAFSPSFVPTFAIPVVEHFANRSTFTGQKIIPSNLEKVAPAYQYSDYTSDTAKVMSQFVHYLPGAKDTSFESPAVLENYVRAWSGNMGGYAIQLMDKALQKSGVYPDPVKPADTLADIPFVKAFVIRYPSSSAQSIQDFYDNLDKTSRFRNTVQMLARQGDFNAVEKLQKTDGALANMVNLQGVSEALGNQSKLVRMVHKDPSMSRTEKRQIIDSVYQGMIDTAREANKMMDQAREQMK